MIERYENSISPFGVGLGGSTCSKITCDLCKTTYNDGIEEERLHIDGDSIRNINFAGLTICDCCYGVFENAILSYIDDIIPWYGRILNKRKKLNDDRLKDLNALKD